MAITSFERRQLERLQEELKERHRAENAPVTKPGSAPNRIYSKDRT